MASMEPGHAEIVLNFLASTVEREHGTNKKVIAAVPADQGAYKPSEKCMSAIDLAYHIASSELFFMNGVADGAFNPANSKRPDSIQTAADVLAMYEVEFPKALARVKALTGEQLVKNINFFDMFNLPGLAYLGLMNNHTVHHRGQLSAYLRPMGAKVPSIYGPSGDEGIAKPAAS